MVSAVVEEFGRLDIAVCNAGIEIKRPFLEVTDEEWERVIGVNLYGAFVVSQAAARRMVEQGDGGKLIYTSSVHEDIPFPGYTSYCASKGGVRMLMRNLAIELAPHRINVNNIAPGAIATPINQDGPRRPRGQGGSADRNTLGPFRQAGGGGGGRGLPGERRGRLHDGEHLLHRRRPDAAGHALLRGGREGEQVPPHRRLRADRRRRTRPRSSPRDGSMDWLCWPRFDSPAVFCRLLDSAEGRMVPRRAGGRYTSVSLATSPATNVLTGGLRDRRRRFRLTDFMPVERLTESAAARTSRRATRSSAWSKGWRASPKWKSASARPSISRGPRRRITPHRNGAVARAGGEALALSCPCELRFDESGALTGRFRVAAGERVWIALDYHPDAGGLEVKPSATTYDAELEQTLAYWREWWSECRYDGPYAGLVRRSALTSKLLTYEPTGALVAAPTTSLPEQVGGVRNWDYRYTWLRDSSLVLYAFSCSAITRRRPTSSAGSTACASPAAAKLQIMYTIDGGARHPRAHARAPRRLPPLAARPRRQRRASTRSNSTSTAKSSTPSTSTTSG